MHKLKHQKAIIVLNFLIFFLLVGVWLVYRVLTDNYVIAAF